MTNFAINTEKFEYKVKSNWKKTALLSIMGGAFIAIGYIAYIYATAFLPSKTSGKILGAALFPVGLLACTFMGGSLFTSDAMASLVWINKKAKWYEVLRHWGLVFAFNFVGAFFVAVICMLGKIFDAQAVKESLINLVVHKSEVEWYATIGSAIFCNLLVVGAVFMTNGMNNEAAKVILTWITITLFVYVGFQHVVANMFVFSIGWLEEARGWDFTTHDSNGALTGEFKSFDAIFQNLIPAMIGNWIAGAVMIPAAYYGIETWSTKHKEAKEDKKSEK